MMLLKELKLHVLAPIFGFCSIAAVRKVNKLILPLMGLILIGLFQAAYLQNMTLLFRVAQLSGILLLFSYLSFEKIDYLKFGYIVMTIGLLYLCLNLIVGSDVFQKPIFGVRLLRLKGMVGEYNFSAAAYLGCALIFLSFKKYYHLVVMLILLVLTGSRAGILATFLAPIFMLVEKSKYLKKTLLLLFLIYPLLVGTTSLLDQDLQVKINQISSKRLSIQRNIFHIIKEKPFGVGYFQGREILKNHKNMTELPYVSHEAHNLVFQVLFEFGIPGLLCLVTFIFMLVNRLNVFYPVTTMLVMFSFLNGLHEIIFYAIISMCLTDKARDIH